MILKNIAEHLPQPLGSKLAFMPFTFRLGLSYMRSVKVIRNAENINIATAEARALIQLRSTIKTVYNEVEFYREFYKKAGFSPNELGSLADWNHVPVVTKSLLQGVPLDARCSKRAKGLRINTGGTSGQPLVFFLDRNAFAIEWAHIHYIWKAHGYCSSHKKLTIRGKHFDRREPLRYNAVHNEYIVNANCKMAEVVDAVLSLPRNVIPRWIHGYPSLVAEFAHALSCQRQTTISGFRERLFGVLLGSEYPAPVYRSVIVNVLSSNVVSWYGHSEMAILARETAQGIYASLPTYGYSEAVPITIGEKYNLVSTSWHNLVHPFIRYDTGDIIEPVSIFGASLVFRISEGRIGDFVFDRHGNRHSLTAIIFGRHHAAFEFLQHLQVRDEGGGCVTLVITPYNQIVDTEFLRQGFDLDDLDIDWKLEIVESPIRTRLGKINLKINKS